VVEQDIRNVFYPYGEIRSITVVPKQVNKTFFLIGLKGQ
jgi:hypothetical protein